MTFESIYFIARYFFNDWEIEDIGIMISHDIRRVSDWSTHDNLENLLIVRIDNR